MIFHENCLPADNSHEISCLICNFLKKRQNFNLSSAANVVEFIKLIAKKL